jgi:hypothetical protein
MQNLTLHAGKPMEHGSVERSLVEEPSDPAFLAILIDKFGSTLECLDVTLEDAPSAEFALYYKFSHLKELSINRIHPQRFQEPFTSSLEYFRGYIALWVYPSIVDNLCNFMTNLTFLDVGTEWLKPPMVTQIGNSLLKLKTLSFNGNSSDIVDALAATPLANTIENLLSNTLCWDWFSQYLLPANAEGPTSFPELRYVQLCEEVWAPPHARAYPAWDCQYRSHRKADPSTIFRYPNRKYCIIFEHRN